MPDPSAAPALHPADPRMRRLLLFGTAICLLTGALVLWALDRWLQGLIGELGGRQPARLELWLRVLSLGAGLLVASASLGLAAWVRRLAAMTRIEARWPPREFRTASAVMVQTETAALAVARQLELCAVLLAVLTLLVLAWMAWIGWPLLG